MDNWSCFIDLIVINHQEYDVLLGQDWFNATGVGIIPSLNKVFWPDEKIKKYKGIPFEEEDALKEDIIMMSEIVNSDDIDPDYLFDEAEWTASKKDFKPEVPLTNEQELKFKDLMKKRSKSFAYTLKELGCCNVLPYKLTLKENANIYQRPHRQSIKEQEEARIQIMELEEAGITKASTSPFSSRLVMVRKPNGSLRICVDYRRLNSATMPLRWPLPRIDDILDRLSGSTCFSTLDLKSGYHQVPLSLLPINVI